MIAAYFFLVERELAFFIGALIKDTIEIHDATTATHLKRTVVVVVGKEFPLLKFRHEKRGS